MADARIFADLKADHDRHRELLNQIGKGGVEKFETFRVEVTAHAAAEEESLYAEMLGKPDLRDDARHSVSEHKEIDDMLGELAELKLGSPAWIAKFKEMRDRYEHHIDEEEEEMFVAASKGLSDEEEAKLAKIFERRKPKELEAAAEGESGDDRE